MVEEELSYYEKEQGWTLSVYARIERGVYEEVGVLWTGDASPEDAFAMFNGVATCYPPRGIVEIASESEHLDYELRLFRTETKKIVASVTWDKDAISNAVDDYNLMEYKTVEVTVRVEVPANVADTPEVWDWDEIAEQDLIEIVNLTNAFDSAILDNIEQQGS